MIKDKIKNMLHEETKQKTSSNQGHLHFYKINKEGNGETIEDNTKHIHKIVSFRVQPSGQPTHTHKITLKLNQVDIVDFNPDY
jgi:hypothetical protein